jgi:hypothetical protein
MSIAWEQNEKAAAAVAMLK